MTTQRVDPPAGHEWRLFEGADCGLEDNLDSPVPDDAFQVVYPVPVGADYYARTITDCPRCGSDSGFGGGTKVYVTRGPGLVTTCPTPGKNAYRSLRELRRRSSSADTSGR